MFNFHQSVLTPKIISNIFLEFENQFCSVVHWGIEDTTEYEIILDENGEEFDSPISITWEKIFDKVKSEKILEKYFEELINSIYSHIDTQLRNYNNYECGSFFHSNNLFFNDYIPEKRFNEINLLFFEGLTGYGHKVILDEIQTELMNYSIKTYHVYFYKFYDRFKEFETIFSRFIINSDFSLPPKLTSSESNRQKLQEINFFDLELVAALTLKQQEKLIELLFSNKTPYQIALLDYLGLFDFLQRRRIAKSEIFKKTSQVLSVSDRTVKGNFYVLNEKTGEDSSRYTSFLFKEEVIKDYQIIYQK
jgi:hypothetical protein